MQLNIAVAKIGKSIKLQKKSWNASGGDNEPLALLQSLANNNPGVRYWIVGRSDWSKISRAEQHRLFPHDNVTDIWSEPEAMRLFQVARDNCKARRDKGDPRDGIYPEDIDPKYDTYVQDYFDEAGIKIDHGVFLVGQMCIANLRNITKLKNDASRTCQPLMMGVLFGLPIMRWLNEREPPYIEVITDQLYDISQPRDLIHMPKHSLGQLDCTYEVEHIRSYEDQTHVISRVKSRYAPIETLFCVGRERLPCDNPRDVGFAVVCNERRPSRYPMLKEWVLDHFPDVAIYGRWTEIRGSKTREARADKIDGDDRFKGGMHLDELHETMRRVKTTFVVPQHRGGVTSKWCEMLHSGVLPFFHPQYDTQKKVAVPDYLRPKTPRELVERVKTMTSDEGLRIAAVRDLRERLLHDGYYDGSVLSDQIMGIVYDDLGREPETAQPVSRDWATPASNSSLQELFA